MFEALPPGSLLMLGALVVPLLPRALRPWTMLALPLLGLARLASLPLGLEASLAIGPYELELVRLDALSRIFGIIFHIAAFLSILYALHVKDAVQQASALLYAGSAIAAVFAGDLLSLFIFWELTAISSVFLILARRGERSLSTALRYLVIQVASGVLLLAGALFRLHDAGTLDFGAIDLAAPGGLLIFLAFGIKAAFPLLHNWLQDAYPEATVTGTVFLSAFTTKLAIYALARGFAGTEILIPIGAAMTAFPIFYAVIENDLRRVLAYSLNNQLGYMVLGIGIGTELALNGAAAHAFAHILYKGLLFMAMGAVLMRTGTANGSDLGGLYRTMPWTTVFCIIGAASISAFPLFSGFVSKSMIVSATAEGHHTLAFLVLLFASAGVFHHSGIKIPYFAFFAHDSGKRPREAPLHMLLAMGGAAALCIGIGIFPKVLYGLLPYPADYVPYTASHVVSQYQLLLFSALAFVFLQKTGLYPPELRSVNLDTDWTYRRALPGLVAGVTRVSDQVLVPIKRAVYYALRWLMVKVALWHKPSGPLGEPWPTGFTALAAAILLAAYLLLYYF